MTIHRTPNTRYRAAVAGELKVRYAPAIIFND